MKSALAQALVIRGSHDFETVAAYEAFVDEAVERMNRPMLARLAQERASLRPLPSSRVPAYTVYEVKVRKWSTIRIANKTYSVPSRLRGHTVTVRQYANEVAVVYQGQVVERMPRLRGGREHRIDYRHVIWSLVHKPGAFARYRYREERFPTPAFREAYDALVRFRGERADVDYVRTLHLAASTLECTVEQALRELLTERVPFDYAAIRDRAVPTKPEIPQLATPEVPDLSVFDGLLATGGFLDRAVNVLAFGLPGTGKTHAMAALGHRLIEQGHSVYFAPTYQLVQELLAAKRDLDLPRKLRKLDHFAVLILDDLAYLKRPRCCSR